MTCSTCFEGTPPVQTPAPVPRDDPRGVRPIGIRTDERRIQGRLRHLTRKIPAQRRRRLSNRALALFARGRQLRRACGHQRERRCGRAWLTLLAGVSPLSGRGGRTPIVSSAFPTRRRRVPRQRLPMTGRWPVSPPTPPPTTPIRAASSRHPTEQAWISGCAECGKQSASPAALAPPSSATSCCTCPVA